MIESFICGMLTNLGTLPTERIHNMLKMFAMGGAASCACGGRHDAAQHCNPLVPHAPTCPPAHTPACPLPPDSLTEDQLRALLRGMCAKEVLLETPAGFELRQPA